MKTNENRVWVIWYRNDPTENFIVCRETFPTEEEAKNSEIYKKLMEEKRINKKAEIAILEVTNVIFSKEESLAVLKRKLEQFKKLGKKPQIKREKQLKW